MSAPFSDGAPRQDQPQASSPNIPTMSGANPHRASASNRDANYRSGRSHQDLPRLSEEGRAAGGAQGPLPPRIQGGQGRRRRRLRDRAGGDGGVPRTQRRGQDDDLEDAFGSDLPDERLGAGARVCPLAAGRRLSPPVRPGDGPEEPALVGPAGRRQLRASSRDLLDSPGRLPAHAGRADRAARGRRADPPGGPRAVAGRADEDGADRGAACTSRNCSCSTSRRSASTWWRR